MYASKYNITFKNGKNFVIFNPLSGAVDIVDKNILNLLNNLSGNIDGELLEKLIKRGYVFQDKESEEKEFLRMYRLYEKYSSIRERFVICPTYSCNLKCVYCFQEGIIQRSSDIMGQKLLDKTFEAIKILHKENPWRELEVSLYGGEPLMARPKQIEIIKKSLERCEDNNYNVTVMTNGVDLDKFVNILARPNVKQVQVTLDGTKEIHDKRRIFHDGSGTFDRIVKGVDSAIENDIKIAVRVNVDSENIKNLPKFVDFLIEKGWDKKVFAYIAPVKHFSCEYTPCIPEYDILKKISEIYKKHDKVKMLTLAGWQGAGTFLNLSKFGRLFPPQFKNCEANVYMYAFDLHGDMYTCLSVCGNKKFSVGKFYPKLELDKEKVDMWRKRSILDIPKCRECKYNLLCGGGCAILSYYEKGSLNEPCCKPIKEALKIGFSTYLGGNVNGIQK